MKEKIIIASIIAILLIGSVSTPVNVMATTKNGYDDITKDNDSDKKVHDDDDHKTHNSCQNIPKETPFRDIWVFVCSLQTQIDSINDKLSHINSGGGTPGTSHSCPIAQNINLNHAHLEMQDLSGCNLSNAVLTDSDLRFTNLQGTKLDHANLEGAALNNADLQGASIIGTDFNHAIVADTNMTGAITDGTETFNFASGPCIGLASCAYLPPPA